MRLLRATTAIVIFLLAVSCPAAEIAVEVESKSASPGESVYLRILLTTDTPLSGLRVPLSTEDYWVTLDSVSFAYTIATPNFIDSTLLSDTLRTEVINFLPTAASPFPEMPVPGGELCRIYFTIDPFAPEHWFEIDTVFQDYTWLDASDRWGNSYIPEFTPGGILISDDAVLVEEEDRLPEKLALGQNYPNPFNSTTKITFSLPRTRLLRIDVYNISGRLVGNLAEGRFSAGRHEVSWNAADRPSGIYIYRLRADDQVLARKMLLLK